MGKYGKKIQWISIHFTTISLFLVKVASERQHCAIKCAKNLSEMRDICTLISVRKMERMLLRE